MVKVVAVAAFAVGVVLISNLAQMIGAGRGVDYGLVSIALWQGIYFLRLKFK